MDRKSSAPGYPEATAVGDHLVIDRTEWVPGPDPQPSRRVPGQEAYPESYRYCLRCGVEALRERDLPPTCDPDLGAGDPDPGAGDPDLEASDSNPGADESNPEHRDEPTGPDRSAGTDPGAPRNRPEAAGPDGRAD